MWWEIQNPQSVKRTYKFGPSKCWFLHQENVENAYQNAKNKDQRNSNDMIYDMELNWKYLMKMLTKFQQVLCDTWSAKMIIGRKIIKVYLKIWKTKINVI